MRILVLGGTAWLGGHLARTAVERGHDVTCLARGSSGDPPPGARLVRADRTAPDAYDAVGDVAWDAVFDVSRQPGQVREATTALSDHCGLFVFVSTASVYADHATPGADESADLLPPLEGDVMESMDDYGAAKVACEEHVRVAFGPDRFLIARAGLLAGPGDTSGRTGYWPLRFARPATEDGSVLVPAAGEQLTQLIDVRDAAEWLVDAAAARTHGVFNVTGAPMRFEKVLETARRVADHEGPVVGVSEDHLLAHGVQPWMGPRSLPLWLPGEEYAGFGARDTRRARDAGLTTRALEETLSDVLAWELAEGAGRARNAGLTDEDERRLLEAGDLPTRAP